MEIFVDSTKHFSGCICIFQVEDQKVTIFVHEECWRSKISKTLPYLLYKWYNVFKLVSGYFSVKKEGLQI